MGGKMPQYKVTQTYCSDGTCYVDGQIIEIDEKQAAWMLRDVPGSIVPVKDDAPIRRVMESAPVDRMVSAVSKKRGE
jgi:hypothetical protein